MTDSFGPADLTYGDITVNFCDPTFQIRMQYGRTGLSAIELAQRIAAYALFANRVIVPSRYLLQKGDTFDALSQMLPLLEGGIIVPDLRQGCDSFVTYVKGGGAGRDDGLYEEHLECARFLDQHAALVFNFDSKNQGAIYKERVIQDLSPGGVLWNLHREDRGFAEGASRLASKYADSPGGRRLLVKMGSKLLPEHKGVIEDWAALRYYTTPAELEPYCIRDFPYKVSSRLREMGMSRPVRFVDPDSEGGMPEPMASAHHVLMGIPETNDADAMRLMALAVVETRQSCKTGAAKFATLTKVGFRDNVEEINALFQEEIWREWEKVDAMSRHRALHSTTSRVIWWSLGAALGYGIGIASDALIPIDTTEIQLGGALGVDSLTDLALTVGLGGLADKGGSELRKRAAPFLETTSHLESNLGIMNLAKGNLPGQ